MIYSIKLYSRRHQKEGRQISRFNTFLRFSSSHNRKSKLIPQLPSLFSFLLTKFGISLWNSFPVLIYPWLSKYFPISRPFSSISVAFFSFLVFSVFPFPFSFTTFFFSSYLIFSFYSYLFVVFYLAFLCYACCLCLFSFKMRKFFFEAFRIGFVLSLSKVSCWLAVFCLSLTSCNRGSLLCLFCFGFFRSSCFVFFVSSATGDLSKI